MVICELGIEQLRGRDYSPSTEKLANMSIHFGSKVMGTMSTQRGKQKTPWMTNANNHLHLWHNWLERTKLSIPLVSGYKISGLALREYYKGLYLK